MSPKIASITMVGHFPDGVDLHIRNLKWFLEPVDYQIYIVTPPRRFEQIKLRDDKVTFITKPTPTDEFGETPQNPGFINFWKWFPAIIRAYAIQPEWFLLMEQDIWFYERFDSFPKPGVVKAFFMEKESYHDVLLDDRVLQPHLWEGAHLVNAEIVRRAIDCKIDFGYRARTLLDRKRGHYETLFGGSITVSGWKGPETLSEFSLYCALEERVGWQHVEKAVHLQGPELLHRKYPQIYERCDPELIERGQRELPYIDIYTAIVVYYITGNRIPHRDVDWIKAGRELRLQLSKIAPTAGEWMTPAQLERFLFVLDRLGLKSTNKRPTSATAP